MDATPIEQPTTTPAEAPPAPGWDWKQNVAGIPDGKPAEVYHVAADTAGTDAAAVAVADAADQDDDDDLYDEAEGDAKAELPLAESVRASQEWHVGKLDGLHDLRIQWNGGRTTLILQFERTQPFAAAHTPSDASARTATVAAALKDDVVCAWRDAEKEWKGHRRTAEVAKAKANALAAECRVLQIEGKGPDLARRLRDLREQVDSRQREAEEAEGLAAELASVLKQREAAVRTRIGEMFRQELQSGCVNREGRVKELLAQLCSNNAPLLDQIVSAQVERQSIGGQMGLASNAPAVQAIMAQIERESTKPAAPATPPAVEQP